MDFIKKLNLKPLNVLKVAGLGVVGLFIITLIFSLFGSTFRNFSNNISGGVTQVSPSYNYDGYDEAYTREESAKSYGGGASSLSIRNISPIMPPSPGGTTGSDAEQFEVTDYNASIETRNLEETCKAITDLKIRTYVIFESANAYDRGCSFSFKVKHDRVAEILAIVKELDPKELSENTYTIKRQIEDFTSETEILEKKRDSIEATLESAIRAYDEITRVATRAQDAASLAKIIESKIQIIERLSQERININEQLDRLSRAKAEQLDRLEYTYFNISVYENKYFDGENLADSWKASIKDFVRTMNQVAQDISINLVAFLFLAAQYVLYFFILVLTAKYGWRLVKRVWEK